MANISGYSILDPSGQQTDFALSKNWLGKRPAELPKRLLSTEYSMMSDAISLVAYSLDELISRPDVGQSLALRQNSERLLDGHDTRAARLESPRRA
jgi:hypothetical protein